MAANWGKVEVAVEMAKGIAFDTCHKIYVLMDDGQMAQMKEYGYDPLISADTTTPEEMLATIKDWYENSCGLRFVSGVRSVDGDPNEGFIDLIGQCEDDDEQDEL